MRALLYFAFAALAAPVGAQAQADSAAGKQTTGNIEQLRQEIVQLRDAGISVPSADSFAIGGRRIAAGTTVAGPVAASGGPIDISGHVSGNVLALHGDVIVHKGGHVSGDAVAVGGRVRLDGGNVDGEMRSLSGIPDAAPTAATPLTHAQSTWSSVKLVLGWFVVLALMGIGVMIFAEHNLDGVVAVLERHPARAFWVGVLAELGILPVLILGVALLCITVVGILLVPFAIVAYVVAVAGLLALGFLAVARFTGRGLFRAPPGAAPRGVSLRALLTGLVFYLGIWFVVAALMWMPGAQPVLRAIAVAITWVALTTGLGAAALSRAGTQHERPRENVLGSSGSEPPSWQTPTPVAGVAAARRPIASTAEKR